MSKKPKENQPSAKQVEAFRKAARELCCDEDEAAFEARLRKIAKAHTLPPKKGEKAKKR